MNPLIPCLILAILLVVGLMMVQEAPRGIDYSNIIIFNSTDWNITPENTTEANLTLRGEIGTGNILVESRVKMTNELNPKFKLLNESPDVMVRIYWHNNTMTPPFNITITDKCYEYECEDRCFRCGDVKPERECAIYKPTPPECVKRLCLISEPCETYRDELSDHDKKRFDMGFNIKGESHIRTFPNQEAYEEWMNATTVEPEYNRTPKFELAADSEKIYTGGEYDMFFVEPDNTFRFNRSVLEDA